ncbi:DegT/DnrJ/EryC1/StrS family aminotransferase [Oceanirhabdus seepicola]|uniref:DegT/DnrJ/EryC1/StrS family aminotransferase n=1 Tax=Oceanirhabdus seepicola TaxID=2828781 RepID=A0A9J6P314_9CLOT|nr:DegT/DnrJ/EryC1/StrS family aminotransferase [Oceanirhabdus seepicola]
MYIPVGKPDITNKEINEVVDVMKSGIFIEGHKVKEFESKISKLFNAKYAIAVNSAESAFHLIVKALDINNGDQVITTPFNYVDPLNCFIAEGGIPVFVDIDPKSYNMDINSIENNITEKTKVILASNSFGQPMDMETLRKIADKYKLYLIEDSCGAMTCKYNGNKIGEFSHATVINLAPNKEITTGEGGILITNDKNMTDVSRSLRARNRIKMEEYVFHKNKGHNYKMSELHAAIGCAQLERLDEIVAEKKKVRDIYNEELSNIRGIKIPYIYENVEINGMTSYVILLDKGIDRQSIMNYLMDNGIECRAYFTPIHIQPYIKADFNYKQGAFPVTEDISNRTVALPFFNGLKRDKIEYIAKKIIEAIYICEESKC